MTILRIEMEVTYPLEDEIQMMAKSSGLGFSEEKWDGDKSKIVIWGEHKPMLKVLNTISGNLDREP